MQPEVAPQAAQPNITIVMPPQAPPVVISPYAAGAQNEAREGTVPAYQPPLEEQPPEPAHYLIAFKDHTVYSVVAYWVDGDTLHYFTAGNTHNQVSLSLIDRDLTARLNRDAGVEVNLPAPKQ
jgi:endonuclease YncB( thermonuclease family)